MGLFKRGKTWWMCFQLDGRQIQKSTGTGSRKLASEIYAKARTMAVEGDWFDACRAKTMTFEEMAGKYLKEHAKKRDPNSVMRLAQVFEGKTLVQITPRLVAEYRGMRLKKVRPATVYQELALLRRMFNVAIREWQWLKDNPVSKVSFSVGSSNARDRWLTDAEERSLLGAASPEWLRELVLFALHTGMRRGEILGLSWKDVDLRRRLVTVQRSKSGAKRAVPMSGTLSGMLLGRSKVIDITCKVFPVTVSALKDGFRRAVKNAGIQDFRFHDLRHTFATRLVQNGVDLYRVKELLGHKTIAMTMRYAHHYPESLRASVEVLDRVSEPESYDNFMTVGASGPDTACQASKESCSINEFRRGSG